MSSSNPRGAFIVFEGCDKSGKSTQCELLVDRLNKDGVKAQLMKFPDRTTPIGMMINNYLQQSCQIEDHAVHLLFAANRWEAMPKMKELLKSGMTLVVDRYSFSGVAFSSAKPNFSVQWCRQPEVGLLRPDQVFYLQVSSEVAAERGDFGTERYENRDFQTKVASIFQELKDPTWTTLDASQSVGDLGDEVYERAMNVVNKARYDSLQELWV
ncbi:thymidylate kinase-like [Babylonia areolata]|uniref:thymidylate kinase-like n=1 Tax=Babylonia areolata TaxID=304850 RepID=UPI003FD4B231